MKTNMLTRFDYDILSKICDAILPAAEAGVTVKAFFDVTITAVDTALSEYDGPYELPADDDLADHMVIESGYEEEAGNVEVELERFEDFQRNLGKTAVQVIDKEDESTILIVEGLLDPMLHFLFEVIQERGVGLRGLLILVVDVSDGLTIQFDTARDLAAGDAWDPGGSFGIGLDRDIRENV